MGTHSARYPAEVRERAVRLVLDHEGEYTSQWEAIGSIAAKIGCTAETLRRWVRQAERDEGLRPGPTSGETARIRELERENRFGFGVVLYDNTDVVPFGDRLAAAPLSSLWN